MLHNETTQTDTEALIKAAAKKVFLKKGLAGTRLQEIADEAGIGRTALHYYFRSKEKLFQVVWKEAFEEMAERGLVMEKSNLLAIEKMQEFVNHYFDKALDEPELDIFMLNEFNNNPSMMMGIVNDGSITGLAPIMLRVIENAVKNGEMKGDPKQIFITFIAVCMFPFAGKAMMKGMMGLNEENYMQLMRERKAFVLDFLKTAFKP